MAITQAQADNADLFHDPETQPCKSSRSNLWRRNGKTKRWKRQPDRFQIPVKHGLYAYSYITNEDTRVHAAIDCPLATTLQPARVDSPGVQAIVR